MLLRLTAALLLSLALAGCAEPPYTNIDSLQLKTLVSQGVPVYDVRRAEEWRATGVLEGSNKLTYIDSSGWQNPEFMPRFTGAVDKTAPVILICRTGSRTNKLARDLAGMGYTRIYNVRDGITRWIGESNPVIKI